MTRSIPRTLRDLLLWGKEIPSLELEPREDVVMSTSPIRIHGMFGAGGKLTLTSHRLIFQPRRYRFSDSATKALGGAECISLNLSEISHLDRRSWIRNFGRGVPGSGSLLIRWAIYSYNFNVPDSIVWLEAIRRGMATAATSDKKSSAQ